MGGYLENFEPQRFVNNVVSNNFVGENNLKSDNGTGKALFHIRSQATVRVIVFADKSNSGKKSEKLIAISSE